jgi:seryl-tRNA synthetase
LHWELVKKKYDIIDFELGVKLQDFQFIKERSTLQRALINFLDKIPLGYNEVQVPHMVNEASAYGTGQLPDKEGKCIMIKRMICT